MQDSGPRLFIRHKELSRKQSNQSSATTNPERAVGSGMPSLLNIILWRK